MPGKELHRKVLSKGNANGTRATEKRMKTASKEVATPGLKAASFGFRGGGGGVHAARTLMLEDLQRLLSCVNNPDVVRADYTNAIERDNCLHKRSGKTRTLSARHLTDLYCLDPSVTLFRTLRYFWNRDPAGQALIALLCAYARDPLLRFSAESILSMPEGINLDREKLRWEFDERFPGRFSKNTLNSIVRNVSSTWTKTGHLVGKVKKVRHQVQPTTGSAGYALLLGYLSGRRGEALFDSEYVKLLDCGKERATELAALASQSGWLVFKRISNVVEVSFPKLLSEEEVEWTREQG